MKHKWKMFVTSLSSSEQDQQLLTWDSRDIRSWTQSRSNRDVKILGCPYEGREVGNLCQGPCLWPSLSHCLALKLVSMGLNLTYPGVNCTPLRKFFLPWVWTKCSAFEHSLCFICTLLMKLRIFYLELHFIAYIAYLSLCCVSDCFIEGYVDCKGTDRR